MKRLVPAVYLCRVPELVRLFRVRPLAGGQGYLIDWRFPAWR